MSGHVEIVAILTPVPGKIDEVKISPGPRLKMQYWSANQMELKLIEGLSVLNQYVEANEPDALRYEMFKQTNSKDGAECLVLIETYKKMEAFESHRTSEVYAMSQKRGAEIQLLAAAPDVKILQHVGGFASR